MIKLLVWGALAILAVMILTALIHLIAPYFAALVVLLIVALSMIDRGKGTKKPPLE